MRSRLGTEPDIDLAQFRGKPVVLNFWATWCGPCYEEHPTLVANARQLGVQFLGVVFQDTEDKIGEVPERARIGAYPTVVDDAGKTAIAYGVGGVPETFFLDRKPGRSSRSSPVRSDGIAAGQSGEGRRPVMRFLSLIVLLVALPLVAQTQAPDASHFVGPPQSAPLAGATLGGGPLRSSALLRCPVCQGLGRRADSKAEMAVNMKGAGPRLCSRGYTQQQILDYFEQSYGEFVLLRPPSSRA